MCESSVEFFLFGTPITAKIAALARKNVEGQEGFRTDSDMAAAAEQPMQLSGDEEEDIKSSRISFVTKKSRGKNEEIFINNVAESKCRLITSKNFREEEDDGGDDDPKGFGAKKR
ncbi:hypothetical protein ACH5RR_012580, partial [Cinchona calisaya]